MLQMLIAAIKEHVCSRVDAAITHRTVILYPTDLAAVAQVTTTGAEQLLRKTSAAGRRAFQPQAKDTLCGHGKRSSILCQKNGAFPAAGKIVDLGGGLAAVNFKCQRKAQ